MNTFSHKHSHYTQQTHMFTEKQTLNFKHKDVSIRNTITHTGCLKKRNTFDLEYLKDDST